MENIIIKINHTMREHLICFLKMIQRRKPMSQANALAFVIGQCLGGDGTGFLNKEELFNYISNNIDFANLYSELIVEEMIYGFDKEVDEILEDDDE
jgi:hypothetical protein